MHVRVSLGQFVRCIVCDFLSHFFGEKGDDIITDAQGPFALSRLIWPTDINGVLSAVYQNHYGYHSDGVINAKFV